jgi:hypothetical protein
VSIDDWVKLITALSAPVTAILLGYLTYLGIRAKEDAREAKGAVTEVKSTLANATTEASKKLNEIRETGESSHRLLNSERATTLRLLMMAYQRAAERPDASSLDHELYDQSMKAYEDHMKGQAQVDRKLGI